MFKMKRLPVEEATEEQIKDYIEALDVDTSDAKSRPGLLALLGSVADDKFIMIADVPQSITDAIAAQIDAVTAPSQRLEGGVGERDPYFKIKINKTEYPGGKDPVPVAVNGRTLVIQRDMPVEIPARYYFALENAIRSEVTQNINTGEITESDISNYPVNTMARPDTATLIAWHMRIDEQLMPA